MGDSPSLNAKIPSCLQLPMIGIQVALKCGTCESGAHIAGMADMPALYQPLLD